MQLPFSYLYTASFLDQSAQSEDQDREWLACFIVEAGTACEARNWGDHLAKGFAARKGSVKFTSSILEIAKLADAKVASLPRVLAGVEVLDEHIGW
jgi:hypothetical protein